MRLSHFAPRAELAPFVRRLTVLETTEPATRTLLPEPSIVIGIRYAGFARQLDQDAARNLPAATVAGLRASARRMYTSVHAGIVLATFHPSGAAAFFAEPLHELFGKTAALEVLLPARDIAQVSERVAEAVDAEARARVLEELLVSRLRAGKRDPLVSAAVREIDRAAGAVRIGELARALELSRDRLEKRFRAAVGASPKQLAAILRVRTAIELHRAGATLTDAAQGAGYFDQSHFIRDFRLFTGEAPRRFFSAVDHC